MGIQGLLLYGAVSGSVPKCMKPYKALITMVLGLLSSSPHRRWGILRPNSDEKAPLNLGPWFFLSLAVFWSVVFRLL